MWLFVVPAALFFLLLACRGAPLGTPVADDYSFLERLTFTRPLDFFDSMGGSYYWRPISRQLYFSLVEPWMFHAPLGIALLHAALIALVGTLAFRIASAFVSAPASAAVAAAVVLSEPARVLLGWPSGAQHLIAAAAAALAVHEALSGRLITSGLAALAGVLSHESAVLALPVIPLAADRSGRGRLPLLRGVTVVVLVGLAWVYGYREALRHGVLLPLGESAGDKGPLLFRLPELYARALAAALNLEDVHGWARWLIVLGWIAIGVGIAASRDVARRRLVAARPLWIAGGLWFAVGALPLAQLLPDWNSWRAYVPTLGLTLAAVAALGAVAPWLAGAAVALKLTALLLSPLAPTSVDRVPPNDGSHVSFRQLVRLQRIVSDSRSALLEGAPTIPRGARVCYWELPRLAEFAFQGSRALEVWYGDSTLTWGGFGGERGLEQPQNVGIEFRYGDSLFAAVVPGPAIESFQGAGRLVNEQRLAEADSALRESMRRLGYQRGPFYASLLHNLAINEGKRGRFAESESLLDVAATVGHETADSWAMRAILAMARGDRAAAIDCVQRSLALKPDHPVALETARQLGLVP